MFQRFAETALAISQTTKKNEKERILAAYFADVDDATLERAVVFFTGSPFPRKDERVTGVGWATVAEAVTTVTGVSLEDLYTKSQRHGDLADAVGEVFPPRADEPVHAVSVLEAGEFFDHLAATAGSKKKLAVLIQLFEKLSRDEARFVVKILLGEFRIGLQEGLVEAAIARAFEQKLEEVRRAHMFNGDLGATSLLAKSNALSTATMTLFHPIGFMLAQPEENPEKILEQLGHGAYADDKYDGMRAQLHADTERVRIYSRTLDPITERFPEIADAARLLPTSVLLDGEIVAFKDRILPFAVLQNRIGRKKVTAELLENAPVAFFAFDLLYLDGVPTFDLPLRERLARLREIVPPTGLIRLSDQSEARSAEHIEELFTAARRRANEGLVIKDPESVYTPGRRGKSWLKYKKALATLDCVVTAAEVGHGKRRGVLSDYTFAVIRDGELVNIGKAYSGLTDVEISQLTEKFKSITEAKYGPVHVVKPEIVLEIAFDRIQESTRHKSGYSMRFPRIVRIRDDKTVDQISTLDDVRRIYEAQLVRESGEGSGETGTGRLGDGEKEGEDTNRE
jgi:DNA ligase-1